jgi:hypothetical protein
VLLGLSYQWGHKGRCLSKKSLLGLEVLFKCRDLPSRFEALNSNPSTAKEREGKKERKKCPPSEGLGHLEIR